VLVCAAACVSLCIALVPANIGCLEQAEAAEAKLSSLLSMEHFETPPSGLLAGIVSWSVRQVCAGWPLLRQLDT